MAELVAQVEHNFAVPQEREGRPTLCTPEIADKILKAISIGSYWEPACVAAGVSYKSVRRWLERASQDDAEGISERSPYCQFRDRLKRAEAEAEVSLARMVASTPDDWRAQAFVLERRYKERWGKQETTTNVVQVVVSDALVSQLSDALRVAQAPQELVRTIEAQASTIVEDDPK